jgi:hypothetical protein
MTWQKQPVKDAKRTGLGGESRHLPHLPYSFSHKLLLTLSFLYLGFHALALSPAQPCASHIASLTQRFFI